MNVFRLIFQFSVGLLCASPLLCPAKTLRVSKTASGQDIYTSVRAAYANAADGDVIEIDADLFLETSGVFSPEKRVQFVPRGGCAVVSVSTPSPNDNFANRIPLTGSSTRGGSITYAATAETGESNHYFNEPARRSVWWTWTAPASGGVSISTDGSDFLTVLAAYTGNSLASLTLAQSGFTDVSQGITYPDRKSVV